MDGRGDVRGGDAPSCIVDDGVRCCGWYGCFGGAALPAGRASTGIRHIIVARA